ncbi:MAG: hypothetical protein KIT19_13515 [Phycisphaeraceae bacterium]|nr:hypothetical protein [Phycisphaeraceae bacterium]
MQHHAMRQGVVSAMRVRHEGMINEADMVSNIASHPSLYLSRQTTASRASA